MTRQLSEDVLDDIAAALVEEAERLADVQDEIDAAEEIARLIGPPRGSRSA
jgi:hypothetical protein